ncbi:hypothetical protein GCM10010207_52890 [Streptomyces atratus]|nr:hypothetical protein GCM10010207_52890 [Streptomyces atratus]
MRQQLDRDAALDQTIAAFPDLPHTAPADERDQLVTAAKNPQNHPRPRSADRQSTLAAPAPSFRDRTDDPTTTIQRQQDGIDCYLGITQRRLALAITDYGGRSAVADTGARAGSRRDRWRERAGH